MTAQDSSKVDGKTVERAFVVHRFSRAIGNLVPVQCRLRARLKTRRNEPPHTPRSRRLLRPTLRHRGGRHRRDARRIRPATRQCNSCTTRLSLFTGYAAAPSARFSKSRRWADPPTPGAAAQSAPEGSARIDAGQHADSHHIQFERADDVGLCSGRRPSTSRRATPRRLMASSNMGAPRFADDDGFLARRRREERQDAAGAGTWRVSVGVGAVAVGAKSPVADGQRHVGQVAEGQFEVGAGDGIRGIEGIGRRSSKWRGSAQPIPSCP